MRRALAVYGAMALLGLGGFAAVAIADNTGTVQVCATATAGSHTVDVDGAPVATVGGDTSTSCATQTYTVPDPVTVTQTQTVTTTAATTTTAAAPTFASATAYTQTRPAFTPTRTVNVSTATAFKNALTNLQAGDLVQATAPFTVTGETTINKALASTAEIDATGVSFVYSGGSNLPAVYVKQSSHIQLYGGDLSTTDTGGTCLLIHGSQQILWWGFKVHDCGGSGVAAFTTYAAIDHLDLEGDVTKIGQNLAYDPHSSDKGTGMHGAILWDAGTTYAFTNSRFAFDVHDTTHGACVELGNSAVAPAGGNTLIAQCDSNPCKATTMTCGNGLELWGDTLSLGLNVKYLSVNGYAGAAIESDNYSGQNASGVTVEYGRASGDLTNPYPGLIPLWDKTGETYQDVQPAP